MLRCNTFIRVKRFVDDLEDPVDYSIGDITNSMSNSIVWDTVSDIVWAIIYRTVKIKVIKEFNDA